MPISFFEWETSDDNARSISVQPSFSRGSVGKRKIARGTDDMDSLMEDEMSVYPEKRMCLTSENPFVSPTGVRRPAHLAENDLLHQQDSNNNSQDMDMQVSQRQQILQDIPSSAPTQSDDHIMDINDDETYSIQAIPHSVQSAGSYGLSSSGMNQSAPSSVSSSSQFNQSGSQSLMSHRRIQDQFCRDYCGSGTVSPRSGHVRCFCKPSWEGMMGINSYFSDIY